MFGRGVICPAWRSTPLGTLILFLCAMADEHAGALLETMLAGGQPDLTAALRENAALRLALEGAIHEAEK